MYEPNCRVLLTQDEVREARTEACNSFLRLLHVHGFTLLPSTILKWWPADVST